MFLNQENLLLGTFLKENLASVNKSYTALFVPDKN